MARRRRDRHQLVLFPDDAFTAAPTDVSVPATPPPAAPSRSRSAPRPLRVPAPGGVTSADARAMVWLRARGEPVSAIARQFHTSRETVLRFLRTPMLIRTLEEQENAARTASSRERDR